MARLGVAVLASVLTVGCGSAYYSHVAVPDTNQRLVVGHDNWPTKQIWVIENGKAESVKVVREPRK